MKIISFNVNGIRAITKKDFIGDMASLDADIICLQETKSTVDQVKDAVKELDQYQVYGNESVRKGYSGTAILTKIEPLSVSLGMGIEEHDQEGRITTLEFTNFFLVCVYVPNSGSELARLSYRQKWDLDFCQYLKQLELKKSVMVCGDFNVAHHPIDLARPKENYNKAAGYMQEEIDGMDHFINHDLMDTYRYLHPNEVKYTWWSYRAGARERNIGWRIDYFLASKQFLTNIKEAFILNEIKGSDHCPVGVIVN